MDLARFIADPFGPSLKSPCRLWRTSPKGQRIPFSSAELGHFGEEIARRWLRKQGWKILYRNYRARRGGEVDIVGRDRGHPRICRSEDSASASPSAIRLMQ